MTGVRRSVRRVARRAARRTGFLPGAPARPRSNGRIAFAGPMPPALSGIATYDEAVLGGLERIGFRDRHPIDVLWPVRREDVAGIGSYELGVFQLGNNVRFHRDVYRLAWTAPGLVVLHDLALDDFVTGLQAVGDPLGYRSLGEAAALRHRMSTDPETFRDAPLTVPWCAAAARVARGVIVHAAFGKRYLEELGCRTPVFVVPHPAVESPDAVRTAEARGRSLRATVAARGGRALLVAPGDVNATKLHDAILEALAGLDAGVHLAIVGRRGAGYDLERLVDQHRLGDRVHVALDVPDDEFLGWIAAADVVVDLRHPHRGEVSGSLARSMQLGQPTVVSATGTYLDVPDEAVVRVSPGRLDPAELRAALAALLDEPERRRRIGDAAAASMRRLIESEATARGYEEAILATRELVLDPARAVLARWARSLADVGIDEPLVAEGFGLSYARALGSFQG
jgi:glycosyltransferase involved in cell wall biosynthesis